MSICKYCGAEGVDHDYQHLARECYPAQINAKNAEIERLRGAAQQAALPVNTEALALADRLAKMPMYYHTHIPGGGEPYIEIPDDMRVDLFSVLRSLAQAPQEYLRGYVSLRDARLVLKEHWLTEIKCEHKSHSDQAICWCGWTSAWYPSVGEALNVWVYHVCEHLTARRTYPVSSTTRATPIMRAAENAAKVVDGWSDTKKDYAERVTASSVTSTNCTCAALGKKNIPHARNCPAVSPANRNTEAG